MPAALSASRRRAASPRRRAGSAPGMRQRAPRILPQRGREEPPARRCAARPRKEGGGGGGSCHVLCGERSASAPRAAERGSCRRPPRALPLSLSLRRTQLRVRVRGAAVPRWGEPLRESRGAGGAPCGPTSCGLRLPAPLAERCEEEAQSLRAARWGEGGGGTGRDGTGRSGVRLCRRTEPRPLRGPTRRTALRKPCGFLDRPHFIRNFSSPAACGRRAGSRVCAAWWGIGEAQKSV